MKGFYSGFAAALAVIALAGLLWVSLSVSQREVSELSQFDAVVASARAQDAADFLSDVVADAALDAAFEARGCQPGPAFCSAQGLAAR
ncbi:MAG: hypothetical protein Q8P02_04705, partial [Candidatus Micrarchaeota archaeon]|nr:hypothetical protein [Candidatus Micrarchaeota archaeon]